MMNQSRAGRIFILILSMLLIFFLVFIWISPHVIVPQANDDYSVQPYGFAGLYPYLIVEQFPEKRSEIQAKGMFAAILSSIATLYAIYLLYESSVSKKRH